MVPSGVGALPRRAELVLLGVLIVSLAAYAITSIVYSRARVEQAERTLNTVISHQNSLNLSFGDINTQLSSLNTSARFDSEQALALVDRSISNSSLAVRTINEDDRSLSSASSDIHSASWLTALGHSSIDHTARRISHAQNALAAARTIAADQAQDGQFWRAMYLGLADFTALSAQSSSGDIAGARTSLARMKGEIDDAAGRADAPGLPSELRALMADLQRFVDDYGKKLDAEAAGDDAGLAAADSAIDTDVAKIGTYDIDHIGTEIDAFYKPLISRYNSEIAAATV